MKRIISSVIVLFSVVCGIHSQVRILVVEKGTHLPIESAYTVVLSGDSSLVCYGYTEVKGLCELPLDTNVQSSGYILNV